MAYDCPTLHLCNRNAHIPIWKGVSVYDGDTYTLADGNKIRLRGVNTPELKPAEDFGESS